MNFASRYLPNKLRRLRFRLRRPVHWPAAAPKGQSICDADDERKTTCCAASRATPPMGQLMRRHWLPACLSEEVAEPDGDAGARAPARRGSRRLPRHARAGSACSDEHCPHRRASLAFGRNEECGLRCLYHGWKFDVDGNVLEMPSEPRGAGLAAEGEAQGLSGARGRRLRLGLHGRRRRDAANSSRRPGRRRRMRESASSKMHVDCNWAQMLEGAIDSRAQLEPAFDRHAARAASTAPRRPTRRWPRPSTDKSPRLQVELTNFGFRYAAIRRPITNPRHP